MLPAQWLFSNGIFKYGRELFFKLNRLLKFPPTLYSSFLFIFKSWKNRLDDALEKEREVYLTALSKLDGQLNGLNVSITVFVYFSSFVSCYVTILIHSFQSSRLLGMLIAYKHQVRFWTKKHFSTISRDIFIISF